jgi:hypothetical protein
MKKYYFIIFMILSAFNIDAQDAGINGRVTDENNSPVIYATVVLKNAGDSSVYKGEVTNESGEFIFQHLKNGSYFLQVNSVGYSIKTLPVFNITDNQIIKLDEIKLSTLSKELNTVTVQAEKPFIERQPDKIVVNVENSIVQAGSSVMEVFEKMPGVLVDQDGNIRLRGKQGVIVVIDGKATALSGQDLANMLKGMSASNVQKVEIITNPSAKWDASGNSGILNIVMKKNKLDGYNGSINFTYGQGRYPKYNSSVSLNYKKNRVNLFFNYSYANRKGFNNLMIDRRFYSNDTLIQKFITDNYLILPFITHNPRLGIDYTLSGKTTLSILTTAFKNEFKPTTVNHSDIFGPGNEKTNSLDFTQHSKFKSDNYELNAQINHKFDTAGQNLTVNLDYGNYKNNSDQFFSTLRTDVLNDSADVIDLTCHQIGTLDLYSVKADYSKPLKHQMTFEAGAKSSLVESDKDMRFYDELNSIHAFDSARSSHFIYRENINAAYVSIQKKFKALTVQAGLRAEQTVAEGLQKLNEKTFIRNYFQVFPTLYLNYDIGKHNINANLGRRINRPGYDQMNPFRRLIDFTTYSEGNPYLLPELTYISELSYSYDNTYFVSLNYSRTTDNITDVLIQDAQTRTTIQSVVNLYKLNYYSVDLSYSKRITKKWKTNANVLVYYSRFNGTVHNFSINQGKPSFSASCNNNLTITENLSAELTLRFNYRDLYGVTLMRNNYNISAGFQQSVFKKRGTFTVNLTDIFWAAYPRGFTEFGDVTENWVSKRDTRVLNIGFTYNLGKGKVGRIRKNTGADEEKNRIQ